MSEKLIQDVEKPKDSEVEIEQALIALFNRKCATKEIDYLKSIMENRTLYDFSGYSGITTILALSEQSSERSYCIKISDQQNSLRESCVLLGFMNRYAWSSKVIRYISTNKDYLVTETVEAPMALSAFPGFKELAKFMGKTLRSFHDTKWNKERMPEEVREILQSRADGFIDKAVSHKNGLAFFAEYLHDFDYESMRLYLIEHRTEYVTDEVIIHGDFNPRNVFSDNSVVDLADTCFGDRHYDICFSIWTVALYSGILGDPGLVKECERIFLESYGGDKISESRMEYCKKLACMYWQENNEINGLI